MPELAAALTVWKPEWPRLKSLFNYYCDYMPGNDFTLPSLKLLIDLFMLYRISFVCFSLSNFYFNSSFFYYLLDQSLWKSWLESLFKCKFWSLGWNCLMSSLSAAVSISSVLICFCCS